MAGGGSKRYEDVAQERLQGGSTMSTLALVLMKTFLFDFVLVKMKSFDFCD